jgi:hypothetical protein
MFTTWNINEYFRHRSFLRSPSRMRLLVCRWSMFSFIVRWISISIVFDTCWYRLFVEWFLQSVECTKKIIVPFIQYTQSFIVMNRTARMMTSIDCRRIRLNIFVAIEMKCIPRENERIHDLNKFYAHSRQQVNINTSRRRRENKKNRRFKKRRTIRNLDEIILRFFAEREKWFICIFSSDNKFDCSQKNFFLNVRFIRVYRCNNNHNSNKQNTVSKENMNIIGHVM